MAKGRGKKKKGIFSLFQGKKAKRQQGRTASFMEGIKLFSAFFLLFLFGIFLFRKAHQTQWYFPASVLKHQAAMERVAKEKGLEEDLDVLFAIMTVESHGKLKDVMQSSESKGLPVNTLDTDASIEQGLKYYKDLKEKARALGLEEKAVIQAYNYGPGFLYYVEKNGGKYTDALAEEFAKNMAKGKTIKYSHSIAKKENGGYRYLYGNMFYARVVEETLQFHREKNKMEITTVQKILMSATAGLFLYIMLLETFMTDSDSTSRVFKMSVRELRNKNINTLFKNQGIYNGLLGLALLYGIFSPGANVELCLVLCSIMFFVAVYGAISSDKMILLKQGTLPFLSLLSLILKW